MNLEEIAKLCASMTLKDAEGPVRRLNDDLKMEGVERLSLSLMGKVLMTKMVNRDAFVGVLKKIWLVQNGVEIEEIRGNVFAYHFMNQEDRRRIWAGGPWTFDDALIVLAEPTGKGEVSQRTKTSWGRRDIKVMRRIVRVDGHGRTENSPARVKNGKDILDEDVTHSEDLMRSRNDCELMRSNDEALLGGGNNSDINGNKSNVLMKEVSVMTEVCNNDVELIVGQDVHLDNLDDVGQVGKDRPFASSVTSEVAQSFSGLVNINNYNGLGEEVSGVCDNPFIPDNKIPFQFWGGQAESKSGKRWVRRPMLKSIVEIGEREDFAHRKRNAPAGAENECLKLKTIREAVGGLVEFDGGNGALFTPFQRDEVHDGKVSSATSSLETMVGSTKVAVGYNVGGRPENNLEIMGDVDGESKVVFQAESEHGYLQSVNSTEKTNLQNLDISAGRSLSARRAQ
ncbi:hypothetical protein Dsin_010661 [Dipteronia sinensis]|uniref:DUF4283 domain-containing protein n=1 Tax=Dipteronia sinensis TaxID=43782 RepID=A0AAE0ASY0_9ROSI|nr:hypothetical protein Dsin_010661 [Dipteronia sinensis]